MVNLKNHDAFLTINSNKDIELLIYTIRLLKCAIVRL